MKIIGIVGGIASGKSTVVEEFRRLGAAVIDADALGHQVLERTDVKRALAARWGDSIFDPRGAIDRRVVAGRVFGEDPEKRAELEFLESVTHPLIGEEIVAQICHLDSQNGPPHVILDAPIMIKAGWDRVCHHIIYVDAPGHLRLERAAARGWSEQEFDARERLQTSLETKRSRSDFVIDNSGSLQHTRDQVQRLWRRLQSGGGSAQPGAGA